MSPLGAAPSLGPPQHCHSPSSFLGPLANETPPIHTRVLGETPSGINTVDGVVGAHSHFIHQSPLSLEGRTQSQEPRGQFQHMAGQAGQLDEAMWRDGNGLIARVPGCLVFLRGN